ncbi:MAG: glycosyltransferase family 4 protein [Acidobacteriota bacterium]
MLGMNPLQGRTIHQVTAGFAPADAISDEARNIRRLLCSWGCRSEIYSWPEHIDRQNRHECRLVSELDSHECDLLIYHFSIGSPATETVLGHRCRRVMIYHNITPSSFFRFFSREVADQLEQGRQQLGRVREAFSLALADSEFNRAELAELGYERTAVLPILFDPASLRVGWKERIRAAWLRRRGETTVFFVGRLAPNKRADDLLRIFSFYQRFYNPRSRFVWVGSAGGMELYAQHLFGLIERFGIRNAIFPGYVSRSVLTSWYLAGDVFASASEHEGFCVPILESFHFGKPVVAYGAAAVPETLGDAGLLLSSKEPEVFAAAIHRAATDSQLRAELVSRGHRRARESFGRERVASILRGHLIAELERPAGL